jgi:murein DD-endopeptidase MepM/ murein hydrolase activator NlpD
MGVDANMGGGSDDLGAPVLATHDGVVVLIGNAGDGNRGGHRITIRSRNGQVQTSYMHLESSPSLSVGDAVSEGQTIGGVGNSGTKNVHLHYEVFRPGADGTMQQVDPQNPDGTMWDPQTLAGGTVTVGQPSAVRVINTVEATRVEPAPLSQL